MGIVNPILIGNTIEIRRLLHEMKSRIAYCGQFDILVTPSMVAGNLLNKGLTVNAITHRIIL